MDRHTHSELNGNYFNGWESVARKTLTTKEAGGDYNLTAAGARQVFNMSTGRTAGSTSRTTMWTLVSEARSRG
ncbi:MAG: hypothetical protein U5N26_11280 [Candidatus Marinimicrobia bacterium]|nr:hypothetical protein [Candidatus Neomarinimicrobiota bacterium]